MGSFGGYAAAAKYAFKFKTPAKIDQIPPVINTYYEVCDLEDVAILYLMAMQEHDAAAAKNHTFKATIDGVVLPEYNIGAMADSTYYFSTLNHTQPGSDSGIWNMTGSTTVKQALSVEAALSGLLYAHSFKWEAKLTEAAGVNQELRCRVCYWQKEET